MSAPLQAFSPPLFLQNLPFDLTPAVLVAWFLYFVIALWAVYTLVVVYHWLKYSHTSAVALPVIGVHVAISLALMVYALTGTIPSL